MRRLSLGLSALLLALPAALLAGSTSASARDTKPPKMSDVKKAMQSALKNDNLKLRSRAFDYLRPVRDPAVFTILTAGVEQVYKQRARIQKEQNDAQADFELQVDKGKALQDWLESSSQTAKDVQRYNKKARKIDRARGEAKRLLQGFEQAFSANEALIQQAGLVASEILTELDGPPLEEALVILDSKWLENKEADRRLLYVNAVWNVQRDLISGRLHTLLDDEEQDNAVRVAALSALVSRRDPIIREKAIATLEAPPEAFQMIAASIWGLRRLHEKAAIVPLIEFLAREDLGRLREDAHDTLKSLTGEKHGPYMDPWKRWWEDAKDAFVMPAEGHDKVGSPDEHKGPSFYGIHTFSKRVLYIVDMSGSMDKLQKGAKGETKWDVAKRQLVSEGIGMMDGDAVFNVILFNHSIVTWQPRIQEASEQVKTAIGKWASTKKPIGGTNIHDALEAGFAMAQQATGTPVIDTIFFLTDGRPTAGKVQDCPLILDRVRDWNSTAMLTIHVVAIGSAKEVDLDFLRTLAEIGNGGEFVHRE